MVEQLTRNEQVVGPTPMGGSGGQCGNSSVGRASASQAEGREFESRFPLKQKKAARASFLYETIPRNVSELLQNGNPLFDGGVGHEHGMERE